jgi:L-amino acid N-acyltransferase
MSIELRPAHPEDAPGILAIVNDAIESTTSIWADDPRTLKEQHEWLYAKQASGLPGLVAADGDSVAGWASFGPFRPYPGYRFTVEHSVYVAGTHRRRGIAARLMQELVREARERGLHAMVGAVDATNDASIQLHTELGFREVARMPEVGTKFGRWLDLVLLQLLLDDTDRPEAGQPSI